MSSSIGRFVAEIGADDSELIAAFESGSRAGQAFARDINRVAATIKPITLDAGTAGLKGGVAAALQELKRLQIAVEQTGQTSAGLPIFRTAAKDVASVVAVLGDVGAKARVVIGDVQAAAQAAVRAPLASADQALAVLRKLGIEAKLVSQSGAGGLQIATSAKDLQTVQGVLGKLGVQANIVTGDLNEIAAATQKVAREATAAASAMERVAGPKVTTNLAAQGNAMTQIAAKNQQAARSFALVNAATGQFTPIGQRAANTAVGVAFGLEAMARGGTAAEGGIRSALRMTSVFATSFGSKGLIVAGVAASVAAIIDLFTAARKEMESTRRQFQEQINKMIDSADAIGLTDEAEKIFRGTPSAGAGLGGGFKGSLLDLRAELKKLNAEALLPAKAVAGISYALAKAGSQVGVVTPLSVSISDVTKRLKEAEAQFGIARQAVVDFQSLRVDRTQTIGISVPGIKEAKSALETLEQQIRSILGAEALIGTPLEVEGLTEQAVKTFNAATAAQERFGNGIGETASKIRGLLADMEKSNTFFVAQARQQFKASDILVTPPDLAAIEKTLRPLTIIGKVEIPQASFTALRSAVDRALLGEKALDLAGLIDDKGLSDKFARSAVAAASRAKSEFAAIGKAILGSNAPLEEQIRLLDEASAIYGQLGKDDPFKQFAENISAVTQSGRGLLQIADGMGAISDNTRQAIDGVLSLVDAVLTLKTAGGGLSGLLAGGVGAIGAAISIGSAVFGESASDKARNQLMKQNNEELAKVRLALLGFKNSVGDQAEVIRALNDPQALDFAGRIKKQNPILNVEPQKDLLKRLGQLGLTKAELQRVAKDNNVNLFDEKGRLLVGAFETLREVLGFTIRDLILLGDSLEDQRTRKNLEQSVFGTTITPALKVENELGFLKNLAPKIFEQFFKGIDLSDGLDAGELARSRKGLEDLTRAYLAGAIDFLDFADIMSKSDFVGLILGADSALDELADSANAATESLRNAPEWFKVEAFRFAAADPIGSNLPRQGAMPPSVIPLLPTGQVNPFGGPGAVGASGTVIIQGDVVIPIAGPFQNADQVAAAVYGKIKTLAGQTGDPIIQRFALGLPS